MGAGENTVLMHTLVEDDVIDVKRSCHQDEWLDGTSRGSGEKVCRVHGVESPSAHCPIWTAVSLGLLLHSGCRRWTIAVGLVLEAPRGAV